MRPARNFVVILCFLSLASQAFGGDGGNSRFDPTDYLKELEFEAAKRRAAEAIEATNVVIAGMPYVKFEAEAGAIYVPKRQQLRAEDLDTALCATSFKETDLGAAAISVAELSLTDTVRQSARLIIDVIRRRCETKATAGVAH